MPGCKLPGSYAEVNGVKTPWSGYGPDAYAPPMKELLKARITSTRTAPKNLTFGDLVAATYDELGDNGARRILQLAMESHLIRFSRSKCMS